MASVTLSGKQSPRCLSEEDWVGSWGQKVQRWYLQQVVNVPDSPAPALRGRPGLLCISCGDRDKLYWERRAHPADSLQPGCKNKGIFV